jgi:hypothetical protein
MLNLQEAFEVLNINSNEIPGLTRDVLKKKYHKMALLNHPDKNGNSLESKTKFQRINDAYHLIEGEITVLSETTTDSQETTNDRSLPGFNIFVNLFMENILSGKYNEFVSSIIKDIVSGCKEVSLKLFEDLDKDRCLFVYDFMVKYKNVLHISDAMIEKVREIILEKYKDIQIFLLNPSIDDLFENNIYKLCLDSDNTFLVPLWHNELYFEDTKQNEIIVRCCPEVPENISIDEENNILVDLSIRLDFSLIKSNKISFLLGKKEFHIKVDDLKLTKIQTHILRRQGISKIQEKDIYGIDKKGDIIVKISFVE